MGVAFSITICDKRDMATDHIIDKLGGTTAVAAALGQNPNAVSNWRAREIPWRWRPALAKIASEKGVELPPEFLGIAA